MRRPSLQSVDVVQELESTKVSKMTAAAEEKERERISRRDILRCAADDRSFESLTALAQRISSEWNSVAIQMLSVSLEWFI